MTLQETREAYEATLAEDAKDKAGKIRVNGAKEFLRACLVANEFEGDIKDAIAAVAGAFGHSGAKRSPKQDALDILVEAGSMTNVECFMKFNKGPSEMRDLMRYAIKDVEPANRVWITFNATGGDVYNVVAQGEEVPEGWTGYMPSDDQGEL